MPKIFLCYRRADNPFAVDWIDHALSERFGREFIVRDISTLPLGLDFRIEIDREVNTCDILLAVIGDRWLDTRYTAGERAGQRRIDDPSDFVRLELEAALSRDIPVIPVLVDQATLPSEHDLPESLQPIIYRGAAEVRSGRDRETHINRLITGITALLEQNVHKQNESEPTQIEPVTESPQDASIESQPEDTVTLSTTEPESQTIPPSQDSHASSEQSEQATPPDTTGEVEEPPSLESDTLVEADQSGISMASDEHLKTINTEDTIAARSATPEPTVKQRRVPYKVLGLAAVVGIMILSFPSGVLS